MRSTDDDVKGQLVLRFLINGHLHPGHFLNGALKLFCSTPFRIGCVGTDDDLGFSLLIVGDDETTIEVCSFGHAAQQRHGSYQTRQDETVFEHYGPPVFLVIIT